MADQRGPEDSGSVTAVLAERIARLGSIRFDEYVEVALYEPGSGFFASPGRSGRAGRAGAHFITSPEVGPLFGEVVSRYLDTRWEELGRPDPYVVIEAGAGRGALAISVLAARPACAPALRYVLVERSPELRSAQAEHLALVHPFEVLGPSGDDEAGGTSPAEGTGPLACSLGDMPVVAVDGVVVANELLDNVPFRLVERVATRGAAGWEEVRVTAEPSGRLVELLVPVEEALAALLDRLAPAAPVGARVPVQDEALKWLRTALGVLRSGSVLVVDYAASMTAAFAERPVGEWLRTYRDHRPGTAPLDAPGTQDVTVEVAVDQLTAAGSPDLDEAQADWLRRHGIDALVAEGNRIWAERAGVGDLAALRARSRAVEAEALCDPAGLGAFRVLEWRRRSAI